MTNQRVTEMAILAACEHLANILIQKNRDYGNSVEERFNEDGPRSLYMRLNDKHKRLETLTNTCNPVFKEETIADTYLDTSGYGILGFLLSMSDKDREDMLTKYVAGQITPTDEPYQAVEVAYVSKEEEKVIGKPVRRKPVKPQKRTRQEQIANSVEAFADSLRLNTMKYNEDALETLYKNVKEAFEELYSVEEKERKRREKEFAVLEKQMQELRRHYVEYNQLGTGFAAISDVLNDLSEDDSSEL